MNEATFREFIKIRFPGKVDPSYIEEWRERFQGGHPENYMDSESLQAYQMAKSLTY